MQHDDAAAEAARIRDDAENLRIAFSGVGDPNIAIAEPPRPVAAVQTMGPVTVASGIQASPHDTGFQEPDYRIALENDSRLQGIDYRATTHDFHLFLFDTIGTVN